MDARLLATLARPVADLTNLFALAPDAAPDQIGDDTLAYSLTGARLLRWRADASGGAWEAARSPLDGTWAATPGPDGGTSGTQLQIGARTPFAFTRSTGRRLSDDLLTLLAPWPCPQPVTPAEVCVDWNDQPVPGGSPLPPVFERGGLVVTTDASPRIGPVAGDLFDLDSVVWLDAQDGGQAWLAIPAPARRVCVQVARADGAIAAAAQSNGVPVAADALDVGPGWLVLEAEGIDWVGLAWPGVPRVYLARVC